jgi:hypothetical protein
VRSLYGSRSLMTVARELARYKLNLVGVQEVRWDKGGTFLWKKVKVKEFHYRPVGSRRLSLTHRSPLPPGNIPESTPGP